MYPVLKAVDLILTDFKGKDPKKRSCQFKTANGGSQIIIKCIFLRIDMLNHD